MPVFAADLRMSRPQSVGAAQPSRAAAYGVFGVDLRPTAGQARPPAFAAGAYPTRSASIHWYTGHEKEYDETLAMRPKGASMNIAEFAREYSISRNVQQVLQTNGFHTAGDIGCYNYKLYRQSTYEDGLGLVVGEAQKLWSAVTAWKHGYSLDHYNLISSSPRPRTSG